MTDTSLQIDRSTITLRGRVEDQLRSAIASGRFLPGQRLIERELCELLNVGRTSVREALRQLEAEGLVQTVPHRGPVVSTLTTDEVQQLYEVRAVVESFAGRKFAERRRKEDLDALSDAVERLGRAAIDADLRDLVASTAAFYAALTKGSGNVFIQRQLKVLHNQIALQRITSMRHSGRIAASVKEVRDILAAIAAGDPDRASEACRRHVEGAARAALTILADTHSGSARENMAPSRVTAANRRAGRRRQNMKEAGDP